MVNQSCILRANQAPHSAGLGVSVRKIALYICLLYNL